MGTPVSNTATTTNTSSSETLIISTTNQASGCNITKITLLGTKDFYGDLVALKQSPTYWTDDDISTVMNFSDGYKMMSHITLAGDGFQNKNSGTCMQIGWITST